MQTIADAIRHALRDFGAMLSIVLLCIGAAVAYGVCHDQITARVCIEYFSVFHPTHVLPDGMDATDPTQQGLFWGVFATWWMGLLIGVPLSIVARVGSRPPLSSRDLVRPVAVLLGVMAACAACAFAVGFAIGENLLSRFATDFMDELQKGELSDVPDKRAFVAVYFAHNASYLAGAFGGLALAFYTVILRWRPKPPANA